MKKREGTRLYAIVDAQNAQVIKTLKAILEPYAPKYRDGKTLVIGGISKVLFIEFRKREGPMFDIMKHMAQSHGLYPFYVIEEDKDKCPKSDKFGNNCQYFLVEAAIMDFDVPAGGFGAWQEDFCTIAKKIYRDDHVSLKVHAYKRDENNTIHAICANSENTNRHAPDGVVRLGEVGWKEAVIKMAEQLGIPVTFRTIRYKNL